MSVTSFNPKITQLTTSEKCPFLFYDKSEESFLLQTCADRTKVQIFDRKNNKLLNMSLLTALSDEEVKIESLKNQKLSFACWNSKNSFLTVTQAGTLAWWKSENDKVACVSSAQIYSKTINKIHKTIINEEFLFIRKGSSTDPTSLIDVYDRFTGNKVHSEIPADLDYLDEAFNASCIFQTKIKKPSSSCIEKYQFNAKEKKIELVKEATLEKTSNRNIRTICATNKEWLVLAPWRQGNIKAQEIEYTVINTLDLSEHSVIKESTSYREILCDNHLVMWSTKLEEGINIWNIHKKEKEASIPWEKLIQKSTDIVSLLHAEIAKKKVTILYQENSTLKTAEFPLEILSIGEKTVKEPELKPKTVSDITKKLSFLSLFKKK